MLGWDIQVEEDFDENFYRETYPDLEGYQSEMAGQVAERLRLFHHYYNHGRHENRFPNRERMEENLPIEQSAWNAVIDDDFDEEFYSKDKNLAGYWMPWARQNGYSERQRMFHHYLVWGKNEGRHKSQTHLDSLAKAADEMFDRTIRGTKLDMMHCAIFINHDSQPFGAPHFLFSLYSMCRNLGEKVLLLDEKDNPELLSKYGITSGECLSFEQNHFLLNRICEYFEPRLIYMNSFSKVLFDFYDLHAHKEKIITHSHELQKYYSERITKPTYVVSEKIRDECVRINRHSPKVQPPMLTKKIRDKMDEAARREPPRVSNSHGDMDGSKVTIGMCGQLQDRKNPRLFEETARKNPSLNFVWIGGEKDYFDNLPNLYHVPSLLEPYGHFMLLDCFVLFSKEDPCPYVVLENLYLGNKVVTFRENIFTDHKHPLLKDLYFEYDGEVSSDSVDEMLRRHAGGKSVGKYPEGKRYVLESFSKPRNVLLGDVLSNMW